MKKICLIRPGVTGMLQNKVDIPYGLLCLGSALKQSGHEVTIIDLTDEAYDIIPEADLYGITSYTVYYDECLKIKTWLRRHRNKNAPIAIGGPHASIMYNEIKKDGFDYIMVGEGEITFPEIADNMTRQENSIVLFGKIVENLDDYPLDYSLVNPDDYVRKLDYQKSVSLMSSRGCLFKCAFCWTANNHSKVRYKSAKSTLQEIDNIFSLYGKRNISFLDDSFLTDKKRAAEIIKGLKERNIIWECECNAIHLQDIETCEMLADGGCRRLFIGVESGSAEMLKRMNKPQTPEIIKRAIDNLKKTKRITVRVSLMVGFPGETWDTLKESADFLSTLNFDEYTLYTFTPFPGTDPFMYPEKYGITKIDDKYDNFFLVKGDSESSYSFETETLTPEIVKEMRSYFKRRMNEKFLNTAQIIMNGN